MTEVTDRTLDDLRRLSRLLRELPKLITETRRRRGLSQRDVARATELTASTIWRVEERQIMAVNTALVLIRWLRLELRREREEQREFVALVRRATGDHGG